MSNQKIVFLEREFILVEGAAITTPEDFARFRASYAHLFPDGSIRRYGTIIGKESDITFLGDDDTEVTSLNGLLDGIV